MEIYLIRHTTPDIARGICYGQADIDVTDSFTKEASHISRFIPPGISRVYSSPLLRCRKLAEYLFPEHSILYQDELKEIHCGEWELLKWDDIPQEAIRPWMQDFVNVSIPGGENYVQLYNRVIGFFRSVQQQAPLAIVSHGGVLRSILAHITQTALKDSFQAFSIHYGAVVRLYPAGNGFSYEVLCNIAPEQKETHKPTIK